MDTMDPTLAARTLDASTEIATAALSGEDPAAVLALVVRSAAELAEADLGLVMAQGQDGSLTVEAAHGAPTVPTVVEPGGLVLSGRSAAARVAPSGMPIVVDDVVDDPRTAPFVPQELRRSGPFAPAPFGTGGGRPGGVPGHPLGGRVADVRAVVRGLRNPGPGIAAPAGLAESARFEVATAGELLGFEPALEVVGDMRDVPVALADHARAALREALSNVVRHSGAHTVSVTLRRDRKGLRLTVTDD